MTATSDPVGDHDEIRDVVERYAAAADAVDGEAAAALFAEDGELVMWLEPGDAQPARRRGRPAIAEAIGLLGTFEGTQHVIANTVVEIDGGTETARARTQCNAHHVERRDGGSVDRVLYIVYTDKLARLHGHWRITRRELRVRWIVEHPVTAP